MSGYWRNPKYRNKPDDLAKEIYLNGLSVKAIKSMQETNGTKIRIRVVMICLNIKSIYAHMSNG